MSNIDNYDIPQNLIFKSADILERGGLRCFVKPDAALFANLLGEEEKLSEITLKLDFFVGDGEILAEGAFKLKTTCRCSRCLKEFKASKTGDFSETFSVKGGLIDIMDKLRQAVIVAADMRHLCSEKCKGLCQICGNDLNRKECGCARKPPSPFAVLKEKYKNKDSKH